MRVRFQLVVSGVLGREMVHYKALPSVQVAVEMDHFLAWFASTRPARAAMESAIAKATRYAVNAPVWALPASA